MRRLTTSTRRLRWQPSRGIQAARSAGGLWYRQGVLGILGRLAHARFAAALYRVSETLEQHPDAQLVYSDEDRIDAQGRRHAPCCKCRWNPDLFLSVNMVGNLLALRTRLARQVGGVRAEFEGAHEYDLLWRCVERLQPSQIAHIPRVLYHRRAAAGQRATAPEALPAGARAINEHLARTNVAAVAESQPNGTYRVHYRLPDSPPLVSLIIPTRNALELLQRCVASVWQYTDYPRYEILLVDNGTDDPDALVYLDRLRNRPNVRVLRDPRPFNYSALNNFAIAQARGEVIGLLNNDVEVISGGWLGTMVSIAWQPGVGAVGARLWYPDGTLQHGGVVLGYGGGAGHAYKRLRRGEAGNQGRAEVMQGYAAVTAACLVVRQDRFLEVGGFNEEDLPITFNDVDLCLKLRERGYRNVWTPFAELYHWESASRGEDDTAEKRARFARELAYLQTRWGAWLADDPAYSPNLTLQREDFSLAWPPRVQDAADGPDASWVCDAAWMVAGRTRGANDDGGVVR